MEYFCGTNPKPGISSLDDSAISISFIKVEKQVVISFEKNKQSFTILGTTYYYILFVTAAANMLFERCKNQTTEIKNKFNEFMNVIDVNDNKFEAFNKIVQSDKY